MQAVKEIVFEDVRACAGDAPAPVPGGEWFAGYGDVLTVEDLAQILRLSVKTVQRQCKRGDLPAVSIGRRWYVPKARLVAFLLGDSEHAG